MATHPTLAASTKDASRAVRRRLHVGAEYQGDGRTHVRVWAPAVDRVEVVFGDRASLLTAEDDHYFAGTIDAVPGDTYQFRLGADDRLYPDPAARYQPRGPHGPSEVVDPSTFAWRDDGWRGVLMSDVVAYELHVGTFTRAGTFAAAIDHLPQLARLGITLIEVMPVAEFDGRFGWGYDGVDLFAPSHLYGRPDDFRRFVDAAHALHVGVILDVVYNHLGPSGNYLRAFAPSYFSDRYENEWGDAINFDGPDAGPVRAFFEANAGYWIDEFHLDGLRLDATQQIFDSSPEHILSSIGRRARSAGSGRSILLVAENEPQDTVLVRRREDGGYGLDALWNDDFHHSAMVALTGRAEAYYCDTHGDPQEFVSAAKYGYLFQGQHYDWQRHPRGTPAWHVPREAFVAFLQNHDQVANSAHGLRGHALTSPGRWRAMTALLLLGPWSPMLFQGQEFQSSAPFLYFADAEPELAEAIAKGRREFLSQFPSVRDFERNADLAEPADPATFEQCHLDWRERTQHAAAFLLHADLLRLRREDAAFKTRELDGSVLSPQAFALRFFTPGHADDRVLIVNLGAHLTRSSFAEPLLAPPAGQDWDVRWSSESPTYGGSGTPDPWPKGQWLIAGESALVLSPRPARERREKTKRRTA